MKRLEADDVRLFQDPIENPGSSGVLELYHAPLPLKAAFNLIRQDTVREIGDAQCLKLAVLCINSTVVPEGLRPMILVFGALPLPELSSPAPSEVSRNMTIVRAMDNVQRFQTQRRTEIVLRHSHVTKVKDSPQTLSKLPIVSKVLVFRTKPKKCTGSFRIMDFDNETAIVQLPHGRRIFRSNSV